jgi:hypothetical protein
LLWIKRFFGVELSAGAYGFSTTEPRIFGHVNEILFCFVTQTFQVAVRGLENPQDVEKRPEH